MVGGSPFASRPRFAVVSHTSIVPRDLGEATPSTRRAWRVQWRPTPASLLTLTLGGVLLHGLGRFVFKAVLYLRSPYSRDPGEGCVLAMVQLLEERGNYFLSLREYPFVHLNYPPVFPALVWPFFHVFGPSLLVPRLLSVLATFGVLAMVYGLVRTSTGSGPLAIAAAGVALGPWFLQTWAPTARVDMLAIFFSLAGLLAFVRGQRLGVVFPLFWLGFFTKQNALLAPAAALLSLLAANTASRFLRTAAGFVVPLVALFGVMVAATNGNAYRHLVTYTAAAGYDWTQVGAGYWVLARTGWPLFAVILVALARTSWAEAAGHWRKLASGPAAPIVLYAILSLASLVTIAKEGAVHNYFIEPWLATVLLAAVALPAATRGLTRGPALAAGACLLAAVVAHYADNERHTIPRAIQYPDEAASFQRVWEVVRETEGPILSENMAALVLNGKPVLVEPFGLLILKRAGLVRTWPIVRDCEAHVFPVVIVEGLLERVPRLGECLAAHYRVAESVAPYRILRPNSAPGPAAASPRE